MSQKESHQFDVTGLGCSEKSRGAALEEPLHGENRAGQSVVFDARAPARRSLSISSALP